jgi:hypothetical protein
MRLFYTLIASGLLILTEIPAEQPPPDFYQDKQQVEFYLEGTKATAGQSQNSYGADEVRFDQLGEWQLVSAPILYLGAPETFFPIRHKEAKFEVSQPPSFSREQMQAEPEALPFEQQASPTPWAKRVTTDSALATYRQQSSLPVSGYAMFYNPHVMPEVVSNRLAMGQISSCGECVGQVALLRAGDLNRRVWLQWADGTVEGPYLVVDVAAQQHVAQLLARNWVVDVDYRTAMRRGMAGPVWVTVWGSPPPASQEQQAPFAPLYPTLPAQTPPPTITPIRVQSDAAPLATQQAIQAAFPTDTPVPAATPLPAIHAMPGASVVEQRGFPPDTPIPTITPLPVIHAVSASAQMPTQMTAATATPFATSTPSPTSPAAQNASLPPTRVVNQSAFPTDTPVPTITPLPAINQTQ